MMAECPKNFAETCARFADGELTYAEENLLLAACEHTHEHYRQLALAMVERRRLGQLLAAAEDLDSVSQTLLTPTLVPDAGYISQRRSASDDNRLFPPRKERTITVAGRWRDLNWLAAVAASLVIGVLCGYGARQIAWSQADGNRPDLIAQTVEHEQDLKPVESQERPDAGEQFAKLELANEQMFEGDSFDDPETLVSLARAMKPTPTLDDQTVEVLRASGVNVERHKHVFLFEISDGRQLAIPAEFTVFRPEL